MASSEPLFSSSPKSPTRMSGSEESLLKGTPKGFESRMQFDAVSYWIVVAQGFGM